MKLSFEKDLRKCNIPKNTCHFYKSEQMNKLALILLFIALNVTDAQSKNMLKFNSNYKSLELSKEKALTFDLELKKGGIYQFNLNQEGIAIYYTLKDSKGNNLYESNFPDDIIGLEKFEYSPKKSQHFSLLIKRFDNPQNTNSGKVSIYVKSLNKEEIKIRNKIKKELEPENKKIVTSIDIDHFWEAFKLLKTQKSKQDSINIIQTVYLDRATNGLLDFMQARELTAEKYIKAIAENKYFYNSIKENTLTAKKAEPIVRDVFNKFSELYDNFTPFKVCFAIGIKNTGGTVTNEFVLIGTEITTTIGLGESFKEEDIIENIRGIVAHECVHTQQKPFQSEKSIKCPLLHQSIKEGACDFIAELISGKSRSSSYGEENEKELWLSFKNELCNQNIENWLYNGHLVKDKPADLGYYIGYEIVKSYYNNSVNKKKAVSDILNMDNPIGFLNQSNYDRKFN